jgi:hypothetical protein
MRTLRSLQPSKKASRKSPEYAANAFMPVETVPACLKSRPSFGIGLTADAFSKPGFRLSPE